jgi:subtilisin family serine protease
LISSAFPVGGRGGGAGGGTFSVAGWWRKLSCAAIEEQSCTMRGRVLPVLAALALGALAAVAFAGNAAGRTRYLVSLAEAPLLETLAASKAVADATGARARPLASAQARTALDGLRGRQSRVLADARAALGRELAPAGAFHVVANGFVLELTATEARRLRDLPGIGSVRAERSYRLHTDRGPAWIGAEALWNGAVAGVAATRGEGVVVGVIDSGINAAHRSFADRGDDGYDHANPRGRLYGLCAQAPVRCNDKLLGIHDFTSEGARDGSDLDGHGSHVAATAAGNVVDAVLDGVTIDVPLRVSGVAPHANLISYKACTEDDGGTTTCTEGALIQALDQAALDGVDVVNFSIGGAARDPWEGVRAGTVRADDMAEAFLNLRAAGVVPVVSAGNDGPYTATVSAPANAPWVIAAANATHDRRFLNRVLGVSGPGVAARNYEGLGISAGLSPRRIVDAADFGHALCGQGEDLDPPYNGRSNPWPPGTFNGEIVVCQRGTQARVAKGYNVRAAGGGGMILYNQASNGDSVVSDDHFLPAVHIGHAAGVDLLAQQAIAQAAGGQLSGAISGYQRLLDGAGDVLNSSSSRGPVVPFGSWLKPDLAAPGTSILAAAPTGTQELAVLSGTSMSAPHIAGAAALLLGLRPVWTVDQVESALLTTALAGVRDFDGTTLADPGQTGSGRLQVAEAARAGLHFAVSRNDYASADPQRAGNPTTLNRPSLVSTRCSGSCTFSRTVTANHGGDWRVEWQAEAGVRMQVSPSGIALGAGQSQALSIEVDVGDPRLPGRQVGGVIVLVGADGVRQAIPVSVYADPGAVRARIDLGAGSGSGYADVAFANLVALPDPQFTASALQPMERRSVTVAAGGADPWANPAANSVVALLTVTGEPGVPSIRTVLADLSSPSARDADLYVGPDLDGDGAPDVDELRCAAEGASATERCVVEVPLAAGASTVVWIYARNALAGTSGQDLLNLDYASLGAPSVANIDSNLLASGPGRVAAQAPFNLRLAWDESRIGPGERWSALVGIAASRAAPAPLARIPLVLTTTQSFTPGAQVLTAGEDALDLHLAAGAAHERIVVDVPVNASSLVVETSGSGEVDLYLATVATPVAGPAIGPAPPRAQARASSIHPGATERIELGVTALTPGRWYLTPVNSGNGIASVRLSARVTTHAAMPMPADNAYYDPARSGHGVFLGQGGGQWVAFWYTYLHDGTPTWYLAQAPLPAANAASWRAALSRYTWNGTAAVGSVVGEVIIAPGVGGRFQWSWRLDGAWHSEALEPLATPACPQTAGGPIDYSGAWYAPALPGYGYSVLTLAGIEVQVSYLYDSAGVPRWLLASNSPFGGGEFRLDQYRGFCPDCAFVAPTSGPAGRVVRSYAAPAQGTATLEANLVAPLAGSWQTTHDTARLTRDLPCR